MFQNIIPSALWIVIPAKMIVACTLERRWIADGTRHRHERLSWNKVDNHWPVCVDWTGGAFVRAPSVRSCQMNKCHFTITVSCVQSALRNIREIFGQIRFSEILITVPSRHFTTIMSCVQSTLRNIRWIFGQIQFPKKYGLRIVTVAFGHTLFFIAWIKFDFFIILWLRHVFTITFVIIRYKKNVSKYPS